MPLKPRHALLEKNREAALLMQSQMVVGVILPLTVVMVGTMVIPLAVRGGSTAVGHGRETGDEQKPSKVHYIWIVQYSLSTGQKFFFAVATLPNHTFLNFGQFLIFYVHFCTYGLWFLEKRIWTIRNPQLIEAPLPCHFSTRQQVDHEVF